MVPKVDVFYKSGDRRMVRVLGVDPGSIVCGYGVVDFDHGKGRVVEFGVIKPGKKYKGLYDRIREIYQKLYEVVKRTGPDEAAFESMFYAKNAQSLMKLSHARAAAILAAVNQDVKIFEYSPREVKKSVTGNGNANKEQVQYMTLKLLGIKETPEFYDATDALAVAICHDTQSKLPKAGRQSWADFVSNNPDKIVKF